MAASPHRWQVGDADSHYEAFDGQPKAPKAIMYYTSASANVAFPP